MKKIFAFFIFSIVTFVSSAQSNSASVANRRTAIRYLQLAKQYAADRLWAEASSQSQLGLEYDDSISDLWYINAVSRYSLGDSKASVLPLVVKALDSKKSQWVDYNRDNARVLYADLLCSTFKFKEALAVLDSKPFIYSADAEYIRVKSYYNLNEKDSLEKARTRVDTARKVYPNDSRFVDLFYNYEYRNLSSEIPENVQRIANSFSASLKNYKDLNDDVLLLSIVFESDSDKRVRDLKAFDAQNHKSILFSYEGFLNGVIDEKMALDYLYKFTDELPVRLSVLESFASTVFPKEIIDEEDNPQTDMEDNAENTEIAEVVEENESNNEEKSGEEIDLLRKEFFDYLNSYNGTILIDINNDLECELRVTFKRGRPENISYDENQDGIVDWSADCDFGVPNSLYISDNKLSVTYGNWPFIQNATYDVENGKQLSFKLIADTLSWTPFDIIANPTLKDNLDLDFFVPSIPNKKRIVSGTEFLMSSSYYVMNSEERPNSFIKISVLSGIPQTAEYFDGEVDSGKLYAMAQFENGIPSFRLVDSDGDGLFETTETYGYNSDKKKQFISKADEIQIITNLFGAPASETGFYVKMIQLDVNGDTIPDFSEEYTEGLGKISIWDTDSDGNWDLKYIKYPEKSSKTISKREDSIFHQPFTNNIITVTTENKIPVNVSVSYADSDKNVEKDVRIFSGQFEGFYWIGTKEKSDDISQFVENEIARVISKENIAQGVSKVIQVGDIRYHFVKIGSFVFVEILPESLDYEIVEIKK